MPADYSQIEKYLYLGGLTVILDADADILHQLNIKHVLSIIDVEIPKVSGIKYKQINASDGNDTDLLTYLPECYLFIENALKHRECVFVHCHVGVSRSATIVVSFLMKNRSLTFEKALKLLKEKRNVNPNKWFCDQLELYEQMGCEIDANNRKFRQYLILDFINNVGYNFIDRDSFMKPLKNYFSKLSSAEKSTALVLGQSYYCSKCRKKLFNDINIVKNELSNANQSLQKCCATVYVEPREWMIDSFNSITNDSRHGTIKCRCNNILGNFDFGLHESLKLCQCPLHKSDENCFFIEIIMANVIKVLK